MKVRVDPARPRSRLRRFAVLAITALASVLPVVLSAAPAEAAAGNIDTSFGDDGIVTTDFGDEESAADVAVQPDGKIVVVGGTGGMDSDFAVARYNANGSLDTTFDTDGMVVTDIGTSEDYGESVVVQADGKIVVTGETLGADTFDFGVVRYNTDGSLDTSFDTDGKTVVDFDTGADFPSEAVLQADGKVVIAGTSTPPGVGTDDLMAVARLNTNGSLDTSFDTDGRVTTDVGVDENDSARDVTVLPDGRIVAVGVAGNATSDFAAVRYTATGALDTTFDNDGKVTTDFGAEDRATGVVLQPDGKLVLAGGAFITTTVDFALARYGTDGSLDTTFGTDGKLTTPIGSDLDFAQDIALQADGKLVVVGFSDGTPEGFAVARYTPAGAFDSTFDNDGKNVTDVTPADDGAIAMALQADGKIVAAGFAEGGTTDDFGVVRWLGDPAVSVTDVTVAEGNTGTTAATFQVSLSAAHDVPVTVRYSTSDGTATAPADYQAVGATDLVFSAGETTKTVTVNVAGDTALEVDEQFSVNLSAVSNVSRIDTVAVGTITNDDTAGGGGGGGGGTSPQGYWLVAADGGVFAFDVPFLGSTGSIRLNQPMVGMANTPSGAGYWMVAADGGVFNFGDAKFFGSTGSIRLSRPIVGMAPTPSGQGYWLVAADGGVFAFGDAKFLGSMGATRLNQPMVGMAATPSGQGYWLVASDGGIFNFGDAKFLGSTGATRLNQPMVGMAPTPSSQGYWLVASDGGVFNFGDAKFHGSTGNIRLNRPVRGMEASSSGQGYWMVASDGGIFNFGDAKFLGSTGATRLNQPMVGMAAR